jgi:hypothetical protein
VRRSQGRHVLRGGTPICAHKAIFTFATTHQAMVAEDTLRDAGIGLEVVPPPRELSPGCGLALRVSLGEASSAIDALASRGAAWEAVHELGLAQEVVKQLG